MLCIEGQFRGSIRQDSCAEDDPAVTSGLGRKEKEYELQQHIRIELQASRSMSHG